MPGGFLGFKNKTTHRERLLYGHVISCTHHPSCELTPRLDASELRLHQPTGRQLRTVRTSSDPSDQHNPCPWWLVAVLGHEGSMPMPCCMTRCHRSNSLNLHRDQPLNRTRQHRVDHLDQRVVYTQAPWLFRCVETFCSSHTGFNVPSANPRTPQSMKKPPTSPFRRMFLCFLGCSFDPQDIAIHGMVGATHCKSCRTGLSPSGTLAASARISAKR